MIRIATLAFLLGGAGAAQAATVINGGFEDPGTFSGPFQTLYAGSSALTGWTIDAGSVDLINTYWAASEGNYNLDMTGDAAATISQTVTGLTAGKRYRLSFDLAGNTDGGPIVKSLMASAGATSGVYTFDNTGTSPSSMGWVSRSLDFVAGSNAALISFASLDQGYWGAALDNVSIAPSAVPLPAAAPLLLAGLGGLALLRRRKRG